MPSSCQDIRLLLLQFPRNAPQTTNNHTIGAALAECLQYSDCVLVERNKPADCLRYPLSETLPTRCQQLKKGYGECK